jgi:hypothetical protein
MSSPTEKNNSTYAQHFDNWTEQDERGADAAGLWYAIPEDPTISGSDFLLCAIKWYEKEGNEQIGLYKYRAHMAARAMGLIAGDTVTSLPTVGVDFVVNQVQEHSDFVVLFRRGLHEKRVRSSFWIQEMKDIYKHLLRQSLRCKYANKDDAMLMAKYIKHRDAIHEYPQQFLNPSLDLIRTMRMRHAMAQYCKNKYGVHGTAREDEKILWLQRCAENNPVIENVMAHLYSREEVTEHYVENVLMDPTGHFGEHEVTMFSETFHVLVAQWSSTEIIYANTNQVFADETGALYQIPHNVALPLKDSSSSSTLPEKATLTNIYTHDDASMHRFNAANKMGHDEKKPKYTKYDFLMDKWRMPPTMNMILSTQQWHWMEKESVVNKIKDNNFECEENYMTSYVEDVFIVNRVKKAMRLGVTDPNAGLASSPFLQEFVPEKGSEQERYRDIILQLHPQVKRQYEKMRYGFKLPHAFDFVTYERMDPESQQEIKDDLRKSILRAEKRIILLHQMKTDHMNKKPIFMNTLHDFYGVYAAVNRRKKTRDTIHLKGKLSTSSMKKWIEYVCSGVDAGVVKKLASPNMSADELMYKCMAYQYKENAYYLWYKKQLPHLKDNMEQFDPNFYIKEEAQRKWFTALRNMDTLVADGRLPKNVTEKELQEYVKSDNNVNVAMSLVTPEEEEQERPAMTPELLKKYMESNARGENPPYEDYDKWYTNMKSLKQLRDNGTLPKDVTQEELQEYVKSNVNIEKAELLATATSEQANTKEKEERLTPELLKKFMERNARGGHPPYKNDNEWYTNMEILEKLKYYELLPETVTIQDLEHYVKSDSNHKLANRIFDIYVDEYESDYHTPIAEVLGIDEFNTIPTKLEELMENNSNSLVHNFNLPQKFDAELEIP